MKYLAITIGPIYRTLSQAKKTRELWGASYLFSYLMREIRKMLASDQYKVIEDSKILIPCQGSGSESLQKGAGLYPDRLIAEVKDGNVETVGLIRGIINSVIQNLANQINLPDISDTLQKHLQVYFIIIEIPDGENIVLNINNHLDAIELQNKINQPWDENYPITDFTDKANGALFLKDAFKGFAKNFEFRSIPEISTIDLRVPKNDLSEEKDWAKVYSTLLQEDYYRKINEIKGNKVRYKVEDKAEEDFLKALKTNDLIGKHFKFYHKYICIVHADGDFIGKTLERIGMNADNVRELSKSLFEYSLKALDLIKEFHGSTVYAGGDDLLFFAPVAYDNGKEKQTIFHLLKKIDKAFEESILNNQNLNLAEPKPTISYGISISYYKYPLQEALKVSRELLFNEAKHFKGKNAVSFRLLKHSGQWFGSTFSKASNAYQEYFFKLLDQVMDDSNFLHSIQYKLLINQKVLECALGEDKKETRLKNFFDNNFNEDVHTIKAEFIDHVRDFILEVYNDNPVKEDHTERVENTLNQVHSMLRFIQFINQEDK